MLNLYPDIENHVV